jgi:hypothetical protein
MNFLSNEQWCYDPHLLAQAAGSGGLTLAGTTVLDSRLVICEYRPNLPA